MFNPFNPYSGVTDNRLFFGSKRTEEVSVMAKQVVSNGFSYVVLAGEKMGKTSFLLRLRETLEISSTDKLKLLNIYLNLSHMMPLDPYIFLQEIINSSIKELCKYSDFEDLDKEKYRLIKSKDVKSLFDDFIDRKLKSLLREGEDVFGKIRLVLLIDDAKHLVAGQEWSEAMYHQLRYLFVDSPLSSRISTVLTGFRQIRDLREKVGSPFNHMQTRFLEGLSVEDTAFMLENTLRNFNSLNITLSPHLIDEFYHMTGGNVFLLTCLCSSIWDKMPAIEIDVLSDIFENLSRNMGNIFAGWYKKLSEQDKELYTFLLKNNDWTEEDRIRTNIKSGWKDSMDVLASMGLIEKKREKCNFYRVTCRFFKEWFINSVGIEVSPSVTVVEAKLSEVSKKFFVYRNGVKTIEDDTAAHEIIDGAINGSGNFRFIIERVFSDGLLIDRDRKISISFPGKISMDLLSHLAINKGLFQSFSQIGYALWQEEFTPKANIQNVKSLMLKELAKKNIDGENIIISRRGGYIFNEEIDVCVITQAIIRCSKCGNPGDINMNSGRCTNIGCNEPLY